MSLLGHYVAISWLVGANLQRLNQLNQLKAILVGYDILFPPELVLAARTKKVKIIAAQERMINSFCYTRMILDHYFVLGKAVKKQLQKKHQGLIPYMYTTGPVRQKDHYEAARKRMKLRDTIANEYRFIVLVLDFHSAKHWYENGRIVANNWKNNLLFYEQILKLCRTFPFARFMIKGKNSDFLSIPYFEEIVERMEQTPNCEIIQDYQTWTPFTSASAADITIALHTSLGDEILAIGKPVIFYDLHGLPSKIFDYGPEATAYSFEDIKEKLDQFFTSPMKYDEKLNPLRDRFFSVPEEPVGDDLNKKLFDILSDKFEKQSTSIVEDISNLN